MSKANVDLNGAMGLIKKSKFILAPLFEGITNSFEAIATKAANKDSQQEFKGKIEINLYFTGLLNETKNLQKIEIKDDGEGFTEKSFERFSTLLDKSKGYNNRGSGRIQFLHRFEKVDILSYYNLNNLIYKRTFQFDIANFISSPIEIAAPECLDTGSIITFSNFKPEKNETGFWDSLTISDIKNELTKKFLLKLYLEQQKENHGAPIISISIFKNNQLIDSITIDPKDIPAPQDKGEISVSYKKINNREGDIEWQKIPNKIEKLEWAYFKLPEADLDKNGIHLCSKNVAIQELTAFKIKKGESFGGFRYLTAVYGDILDRETSVSDSVDKFLLPLQKDVEKEAKEDLFFDSDKEYLFIDDIEKEVKNILPRIYTELQEIKEEQKIRVSAIAQAHGIPDEIAKSINIDLSDTEEKITEKMYKKQAEELAKTNIKIKQLFDNLTSLNPLSETYQKELTTKGSELLDLIPEQNKQELSRYVIRREMITKVLSLILDNKLQAQIDAETNNERLEREGLIHDLIFKRKKTTGEELNDLWILNEEFMHFEGCSEIPLNQITDSKGEKLLRDFDNEDALLSQFGINKLIRRPDIFLFAEEGKCVLIEFKRADVDLSNYLNQIPKYCNLIANCARSKIDRFYCYLIGETIDRVDVPADFDRSVYGDLVKPYQPIRSFEEGKQDLTIASMYQEIIQLSAIGKRAAIRNKSFADKLGIRLPNK